MCHNSSMNLFHEYINSTICNCYQLLIKIVSVKSSKSLFKDFHTTVFFKNWTIESFPKLKLQSIEIWSENSTNFKVANKWAAVYVQPYLTPCTSFVLALLIFKCTVQRLNRNVAIGYFFRSTKIQWVQWPCINLYLRTKTLAEFPDHILNDYGKIYG